MKNQPFLFFLLTLFLCIGFSACDRRLDKTQEEETEPRQESRGDSTDAYQHEAETYESADRVIWQKPDLIVKQLGDLDGKVVADLGAGTGYFSRRIAYRGAKVIAIDIDPKAVQWMQAQKARFPAELQDRLVIRQATPDDPMLKPNEVDMVLLVNTYAYIGDRVNYFSRLKNAIRAEGYIVIIDFKKKETPFGPPLEERLDVAQVRKELMDAGYKILAVDEEALEYQYIIKAASD